MRRYGQLSADEQARAQQIKLDQLQAGLDASLTDDPNIAPRLQQLATQRAKAALYPEPTDDLVVLPPPPA
jgi:hypothetical protein